MTDGEFSRRDWLRTAPMVTLSLTGVGSGIAAEGGQESKSGVESTSDSYEQVAKLAADDGGSGDTFGWSVAVSSDGSTALIGARGDGSAYVFELSSDSWTQQQKLTPDDGDSGDTFGWSVAVSSDGSTALIGARGDGSAYVFEQSGGSWTEQQKLTPDNGDEEDDFGWSVAVSSDGSTALVADRGDNSVYVFELSSGSWTQQQKLTADDGAFGESVALSSDGGTALVGAERDGGPNGAAAGSAYVFNRSGGSWAQQQKFAPDDGDSRDQFGHSVALSSDGSTALIGANRDEDPNGGDAGSAYVFELSSGSWTQQQKLVPDDGDSNDEFGTSVAVSSDGNTALIGAKGDEDPNGDKDDPFTDAGSAYAFGQSDDSWTQQQKLVPDDGDERDWYGYSVAMTGDGSTALMGAPGDEDPNGGRAGSTYIFSSGTNSNTAPTADAGSDQTVSLGETVTLDASGSSDPDGDSLSYTWSQTAGPDLTLRNADTVTPEFTAPVVDTETNLVFEVTASDGTATDTDSVTATIVPGDAGELQEWVFETGGPIVSSPAVVDGTVYVGSEDNNLYAVDATSGEKEWEFKTGSAIRSSPAVVDGTVYVGSFDNTLYAVDATSGEKEWAFETENAVNSSPAVANGTVYIGSNDTNMYAVDADSGEKEWAYETAYGDPSSPTVADGTVYIGGMDNNLHAVDADSGEKEWTFETGATVSSSPTVADGTVYVGSDDTNLYAVSAGSGEKEWSFKTGEWVESSPTVVDETVYVGSLDYYLYAVNASSGKKKWAFKTEDFVQSSPAVVNETVYIGSEDNNLYAVDATLGEKEWAFETGDRVLSSPAVADGTVYVGSSDTKLYAVDTGKDSGGPTVADYTNESGIVDSGGVKTAIDDMQRGDIEADLLRNVINSWESGNPVT